MATDDSTTSSRAGRALTGAVRTAFRLLADLLIVGLWVLLLTLLFLEATWPRWAFYVLLVLGVGAYVTVTAEWWRRDEPSSD